MKTDATALSEHVIATTLEVAELIKNGVPREYGSRVLSALIDCEIAIEQAIEDYPHAVCLRDMHAAVNRFTRQTYDAVQTDRLLEIFERTGQVPGERN